MALDIHLIRTPNRTAFTIESKAAGTTQLLYEFQLEDFTFDQLDSNAGFYRFRITGGDHASIVVGSSYAFRAYNGTVKVIGEVTDLTTNLVTVDQAYTGAVVAIDGGLVNLTTESTPSFRMVININNLSVVDYVFVPDHYGFMYLDLGRVVEPLLIDAAIDIFLATGQISPFKVISLDYYGVYDGGTISVQTTPDTLVTLAERQLQSFLGCNLWEMIQKEASPPDYTEALLLTKFESMETYKWKGWKRTISCLIDPDWSTRIPLLVQWFSEEVNVNNARLGGTADTENISSTPGIYSYEIPETFTYPETYGRFVTVRERTPLYETAERITFVYRDECENPIMVEWLNEDGAVEQWLFNIDQVVVDDVEQGLRYERPVLRDIELVIRTKFRQVDKWTQRITLFDKHLTQDQVDALHDIKRSDFVRVWLTKDGTETIGVIVIPPYSDTFNTKHPLNEFSLTIEFPDNFDFFNAKKY